MNPSDSKSILCTALVRPPGPDFANALSAHPQKLSIDWRRAAKQHERYVQALQTAGARIEALPPLAGHPDAPFVEDTAILVADRALVCSLKETSRRGETESVARALQKHRPLTHLPEPATLDGGDVLDTDAALFVGQSSRTGAHCLDTLRQLSAKPVVPVAVHAGLHLKSSVGTLGGKHLLLCPSRVDTGPFRDFEWIEVNDDEAYGANCLTLGSTVLMARGFDRLAARVAALGLNVVELDMSEFEKADGAVTCLSLLIPQRESA